MARAATQSPFPRMPLIGGGLAIVVALAAAVIGPSSVGGRVELPPSPLLAERTLQFTNRDDGAVLVTEKGAVVAVFEGEQGFLRGILRGLNRDRKVHGIDPTEPYRVAAHADGRVIVEDTATHRVVDLEAFGHSNVAVFAGLLPLRERQP